MKLNVNRHGGRKKKGAPATATSDVAASSIGNPDTHQHGQEDLNATESQEPTINIRSIMQKLSIISMKIILNLFV